MTMTQEEINMRVVDVLDQLCQEVERQRRGSSLTNIAGVKRDIRMLRDYLLSTERSPPRKLDIPL